MFRSRPQLVIQGLALCALACLACGCEQEVADGAESCEALAAKRAELTASMDALDEIVQGVPADAVRYADRTSEELIRFTDALQAVNADMDAMYEAHEVACKWPLIEGGDFDGVNEALYLPHIELVGRQHAALVAVADKLEDAGPEEVVGATAEGYRRTAELLVDGLRAQILVCQTDFSDQSCRAYKEAVEARFGKPTLALPKSDTEDGAARDGEAPDDEAAEQ